MDFLIAFYISCLTISELLGGKTFPLLTWGWLHLNASVVIFIFPFLFTINDVVIEVYGHKRAQSIVQSGLFTVFFLILYSVFATNLPPSAKFKNMEATYDAIFSQSTRIATASLIAFAVSGLLDIAIFVKIRQKLGKKALWLRNNASNFVSHFFDTVIFMTLAFYTLEQSPSSNLQFLTSLIIPYWMLKCSMSVVETPLVYLGVKWLRGGRK